MPDHSGKRDWFIYYTVVNKHSRIRPILTNVSTLNSHFTNLFLILRNVLKPLNKIHIIVDYIHLFSFDILLTFELTFQRNAKTSQAPSFQLLTTRVSRHTHAQLQRFTVWRWRSRYRHVIVRSLLAKVVTTCHNQGCGSNVWDSRQNMVGTKIPDGNFLLSFAILVAGGSPSKTLRIFEHMGLSCIALSTYFRHQSVSYIFFIQ